MVTYTQKNRPLAVSTPLSPDALLLTGFAGREGISQLFAFQLDLLAENKTSIAFDQLLGQSMAVEMELPAGKKRHCFGDPYRVAAPAANTTAATTTSA